MPTENNVSGVPTHISAGWCSACGENVRLRPDGRCERGHRPYLIWARYDATPPDGSAPAVDKAPRRVDRVRLVVAGVLAISIIAIAFFALLRGQSESPGASAGGTQGSFDPYGLSYDAVTARERADIKELAEADFPGWPIREVVTDYGYVDFNEKRFIVWLIPPGRDFTVGVVYNRESDGDIVRDDEVLAPGAPGHHNADELLEVVEQAYVKKGATRIVASSYYDGIASIEWSKTTKEGLTLGTEDGFDQLEYDAIKQEWSITRSPEWR